MSEEFDLKFYPLSVGIVTLVSCKQQLRSMNKEDWEELSSSSDVVWSSLLPCKGNVEEKSFWIDLNCIPRSLSLLCFTILNKTKARVRDQIQLKRRWSMRRETTETKRNLWGILFQVDEEQFRFWTQPLGQCSYINQVNHILYDHNPQRFENW